MREQFVNNDRKKLRTL